MRLDRLDAAARRNRSLRRPMQRKQPGQAFDALEGFFVETGPCVPWSVRAPLHLVQEVLRVDRLHQVLVEARGQRAQPVLRPALPGDGDQLARAVAPLCRSTLPTM
jgi:hypothetical protein